MANNAAPRIASLAQEKQASLNFTDCSYHVHTRANKEPKVLIKDLSASVPAGSVLALMGPSGAGKTTLLNLLTLEPSGGQPYGTVTLNGHPLSLDLYRKHAANVAQDDELWAFLTAREHITYALSLYQPHRTPQEHTDFVEDMLKQVIRTAIALTCTQPLPAISPALASPCTQPLPAMLEQVGLRSAADVKAGNIFFKGLSGGQRRRLSLAVALCKQPHVVFLDEPTSGLDAASAAAIMNFLKERRCLCIPQRARALAYFPSLTG